MEVRQLQYFIAVAEVLNFGRAAESLGVGQPAVSQQIARLERELGVTLVDRSTRSVRLTEAGARLLPAARHVLDAVSEARAAAVGHSPHSMQHLRLGTSTGLGDQLERVLAELARTAPDLHVELVSASTQLRLERVRAGQLDATFVRGVAAASGLDVVKVWDEDLVIALPATHPLATQAVIELAALAEMPLRLVSRALNAPLVDAVVAACAAAGFTPIMQPRQQSLPDTLASIGADRTGGSGGSWTVLYAAHARAIRSSLVVFRPCDRAELQMTTSLAMRADSPARLLGPLLAACATVAEQSITTHHERA